MNKPNGYDAAQASGSYTPVALGGHICTIKRVAETKSKNGADMIVVLFDFDREDAQQGYFQAEFNASTKEGKKWPFNGTNWIVVNDYQDPSKTSGKFKGFCEFVEKSNSGFKVNWGLEDWGKQFVGKRIGAVYGQEEDEYNGEYRLRPRLKWFTTTEQARKAEIPAIKYLKNKPQQAAAAAAPAPTAPAGFQPVADDDIPF